MATHALSRRGFLGHAVLACTTLSPPALAGGTLAALIARYRDASDAMGEASNREDIEPSAKHKVVLDVATAAYCAALNELLSYRPATLAEAGERFAFLYSRQGAWHMCVPDEDEVRLIAESMMPEAA